MIKPQQKTVWRNPEQKMSSEYGMIPYEDWCMKEISRMKKGNPHLDYFIEKNRSGQIALFVKTRQRVRI